MRLQKKLSLDSLSIRFWNCQSVELTGNLTVVKSLTYVPVLTFTAS